MTPSRIRFAPGSHFRIELDGRSIMTTPRLHLATVWALMVALALACPGCGQLKPPIPTQYGSAQGKSINGTRSFVDLLKAQRHRVTVSRMLSERQVTGMDVIVRFAQYAGPPDMEETNLYRKWLSQDPNRRLVYVLPSYRAEKEYWTSVKARLGPDDPADAASRIDRALNDSSPTIYPDPNLPTGAGDQPGTPLFEVDAPTTAPKTAPGTGKATIKPVTPKPATPPVAAPPVKPATPKIATLPPLTGEWARDVDAAKAKLPVGPDFRLKAVKHPETLLKVEGKDFVATGQSYALGQADGGWILVVNNGAFLTNGGLMNQDRRKLTARLLHWIESANEERDILVVEGWRPAQLGNHPWAFQALTAPPLNRIMPHWLILGLLACWSRALRLGRPRDETQKRDDRVEANPEAVGDLLAHTQNERAAQDLLRTYYDWRKSPVRHRQR